ncbi:MAG: hypothetical protein M3O71_07345 [Bacteroidota bacterium]|nr:hypothetical protein [Bacteroidota bacterium]
MKLINNQETLLFDEIKIHLAEGSEVFISASYFTVNAIFELALELNKVKRIQILIDSDVLQDIRFAYDEKEFGKNLELRGKYKAETTFATVKDKCQIRYGNMGGQKFILIKNDGKTHCFSIAPHDINLISFGLLPSKNPVITTSFEDMGDQYLTLFNQFWANSTRDIKDGVLALIQKADDNES